MITGLLMRAPAGDTRPAGPLHPLSFDAAAGCYLRGAALPARGLAGLMWASSPSDGA